jgi:hypothetical protein
MDFRIDLSDDALTCGVKFVKTSLVFLFFTAFGPKQYPIKSNLVFGYLPLRFTSLQ